jgi:hypothetical protein
MTIPTCSAPLTVNTVTVVPVQTVALPAAMFHRSRDLIHTQSPVAAQLPAGQKLCSDVVEF